MRRANVRIAWWLAGVLLAGCGSLLGIEELSSEPAPGDAGDAGATADGGGDGGGAGGSDAGSEGGARMDSSSGTDAAVDATTRVDAGDGEDAGKEDAGMDAGPTGTTVSGTVIDYLGNPVPGVVVTIEGDTTATDASGAFSVEYVDATYDVALTVTATRYGNTEIAGWLYEDLTRRDPTLQVYRGLPLRSGDVDRTVTSFPASLPADDRVLTCWGGQYGSYYDQVSAEVVSTSGDWEGPAMAAGTARVLHFTNSSGAPPLPTAYHAFDEGALTMDDSATAAVTLDITSGGPLTTSTIGGNVTTGGLSPLHVGVYLRWSDGATLRVVDHPAAATTFSYLVPTISGASLFVVARSDDGGYPPLSAAFAHDVAPGTTDVALTLPTPATPTLPGAGATGVTVSTKFAWTGANQVYVFRVVSVNYYDDFYVVTHAKQARLPANPITELMLRAGENYTWSVRAHGRFDTTDQATGAGGLLGPYDEGEPRGKRSLSGTFTESQRRGFSVAP